MREIGAHGHQHARTHGIDATRRIVEETNHVNVLVMTMHEDAEAVFEAISTGAHGYPLKGAAQGETFRAIRSVANGEAIFGPGIAERLPRFLSTPPVLEPSWPFRSAPTQRSRSRDSSRTADVLSQKRPQFRHLAELRVADRAEAGLVARTAGLRDSRS